MKAGNIIALSLLLACAGTARAQKSSKPIFKSLYTDMKSDCRTLEEPTGNTHGGDPAGACKGYGGYRIFISHSAWSASFSVEKLGNPDESITLGTDYPGYGEKGEKVEWRTANGKPFAVIMRVGKYKELGDGENPYTEGNRAGSVLVVKGLKGWENIDFEVDGATPNANARARVMVDEKYFKRRTRAK